MVAPSLAQRLTALSGLLGAGGGATGAEEPAQGAQLILQRRDLRLDGLGRLKYEGWCRGHGRYWTTTR
jgi:hypothetical protein